jgi:chromosome segregation ATPase
LDCRLATFDDRLNAFDASLVAMTDDVSELRTTLSRFGASLVQSSRDLDGFKDTLGGRSSRLERECAAMAQAIRRIENDTAGLKREAESTRRIGSDLVELKRVIESTRRSVVKSQGNISRLQSAVENLPIRRLESEIANLSAAARVSEQRESKDVGTETDRDLCDVAAVRQQLQERSARPSQTYVLGRQIAELKTELGRKRMELGVVQISSKRLTLSMRRVIDRLGAVQGSQPQPPRSAALEQKVKQIEEARVERLSKLEEQLGEGAAKLAELQSQIRDIEFVNQQLRSQLSDRTREPKLGIMTLVETRQCDRDVLSDIARQMAFLRVQTAETNKAIE